MVKAAVVTGGIEGGGGGEKIGGSDGDVGGKEGTNG